MKRESLEFMSMDHDYTETDFLACVMECGTLDGHMPNSDGYWGEVGKWFERHYPHRYAAGSDGFFVGKEYKNQIAFKVQLYNWFIETAEQNERALS